MTYPMTYPWTKEEASIVKACWSTDVGREALVLIVERLGMLHGDSYDDHPHRMAWIAGRRFVSREIMRVVNQPIDKIVQEEPTDVRHGPITATERAALASSGTYARPGRRPAG